VDGYRFPKHQGKPAFHESEKPSPNAGFCDSRAARAGAPFRFDSSRYLNCSSNLTGHDGSNTPAGMIPKSGYRFSDQIMPKQSKDRRGKLQGAALGQEPRSGSI
jgi:hypothetical protein